MKYEHFCEALGRLCNKRYPDLEAVPHTLQKLLQEHVVVLSQAVPEDAVGVELMEAEVRQVLQGWDKTLKLVSPPSLHGAPSLLPELGVALSGGIHANGNGMHVSMCVCACVCGCHVCGCSCLSSMR